MEQVIKKLKEKLSTINKKDIPIASAVIDSNKNIISIETNRKELLNDASAHAELLAIRSASNILKNWHLDNYTLITTLEPCPMCYYTILEARISKIIFLTKDTKNGFKNGPTDHTKLKGIKKIPEIIYIKTPIFKKILQDFFKQLRKN